MSLGHRLNLARNVFLEYARRRRCERPCKAAQAVELADAIEGVIDRITELETETMSAIAEAIRFERARAEKAEAAVTDLTAKLAAATAAAPDADDQAELAKVAEEQKAANPS